MSFNIQTCMSCKYAAEQIKKILVDWDEVYLENYLLPYISDYNVEKELREAEKEYNIRKEKFDEEMITREIVMDNFKRAFRSARDIDKQNVFVRSDAETCIYAIHFICYLLRPIFDEKFDVAYDPYFPNAKIILNYMLEENVRYNEFSSELKKYNKGARQYLDEINQFDKLWKNIYQKNGLNNLSES